MGRTFITPKKLKAKTDWTVSDEVKTLDSQYL